MAVLVLLDAVVVVAGTDLSDCVVSVEIDDGAEEVDLGGFNVAHYLEVGQGLKDATITVDAIQDFGDSKVDDTLWPLYEAAEPFEITVKADDAETSAGNPEWRMTTQLFSYDPIAGEVGEASVTTLEFLNVGLGGMVRSIGPYVGIDADTDPFFDAAGYFVNWAGIGADTDPYIDVSGAIEGPALVFSDGDDDVAIEIS